MAINGTTSALITPRAAQMSRSRAANSIASAYRKSSKPNIPASAMHSGLIAHRACGCARRNQLLDQHQPEYGESQMKAERRPRGLARRASRDNGRPSSSARLASIAATHDRSPTHRGNAGRVLVGFADPAIRLPTNRNQTPYLRTSVDAGQQPHGGPVRQGDRQRRLRPRVPSPASPRAAGPPGRWAASARPSAAQNPGSRRARGRSSRRPRWRGCLRSRRARLVGEELNSNRVQEEEYPREPAARARSVPCAAATWSLCGVTGSSG